MLLDAHPDLGLKPTLVGVGSSPLVYSIGDLLTAHVYSTRLVAHRRPPSACASQARITSWRLRPGFPLEPCSTSDISQQ